MLHQPFHQPRSLPPSAFQSFNIHQDDDRLDADACRRAGCGFYLRGWRMVFDESDAAGAARARAVRASGRTFREQRTGEGLTVFRFERGQRCFGRHFTTPEIFQVRGGDWRRDLGLIREHERAADWVEHMQESLGAFADAQRRG